MKTDNMIDKVHLINIVDKLQKSNPTDPDIVKEIAEFPKLHEIW